MYRTVLVPTDGSEAATTATTYAVDIAAKYGATIHALYVVEVRMSPISTDMDRGEVGELVEQSDTNPTKTICERADTLDEDSRTALQKYTEQHAIML